MAQRLSEHAEQVRLAGQLLFDGVSIGNHLSYASTAWFPPFETLMRLAAEADGMSLGTCMLILPLYDPRHVAAQVALLDAASGGRAILGRAFARPHGPGRAGNAMRHTPRCQLRDRG
jgi:alkanesulfonate monooxygenase SsuD/methylene tetrahydromethanopterin reductase-like flavin-dependent oxidoreductase (luciferase family)